MLLIGGSTASGKSELALRLAEKVDAVIVNADSQQLFADLRVLTARPSKADEGRAPHRLYGTLRARTQPSVALWLDLLAPAVDEARARNALPIVVGGTGLYLHALINGLPEMPEIDPVIRRDLRDQAAREPAQALHDRLRDVDPAMAERLEPGDRQRLLRALEVTLSTGASLLEWQRRPRRRVVDIGSFAALALLPPADATALRIARRTEAMIDAGAGEEVAALNEREPDIRSLPIAKVHGLRTILELVEGRTARAAAVEKIAVEVRQYAKRQRTWFRHQQPAFHAYGSFGGDTRVLDDAVRLVDGLPRR